VSEKIEFEARAIQGRSRPDGCVEITLLKRGGVEQSFKLGMLFDVTMESIKEEPELKLCPFCGGEAWRRATSGGWLVECPDCNNKTAMHSTRKAAEVAWNSRVS
jgi:ribosomal protein L37AE/L43A